MTTFRWYLLGLLLLFGGYVYFEYTRPKPLDWNPTLSNKDKIPYGTYALFDGLPPVLGTDSVEGVREPIYNQLFGTEEPDARRGRSWTEEDLPDSVVRDTAAARRREEEAQRDQANDAAAALVESTQQSLVATHAQYLFVNRYFSCTRLETNALLRFVEQGHNVFIAAEDIDSRGRGPSLADTLGVTFYRPDSTLAEAVRLPTGRRVSDSVQLHLLRPRPGLAASTFYFRREVTKHRLGLRASRPHHGATLATDAQGRAVLLRLDVGRGHFFLCSTPLAFGNYWVLRPRTGDFAFAALSYLPAGHPIWWDEYQKQGRSGDQSLLHVLIESPALSKAYYLLLGAGLLFVLVAARRRQRIIPTLRPLPNTSLLFTRTVASLYRQGRNHQRIADKKVSLFLDYLRTRFQEQTVDLSDATFRERLSQKAGVPAPRVDELVRLINFARTAPVVSDRELLILSRAIQDFKRESS